MDRAAGSIVGHCSPCMRLRVYRKSTATRRYVPGDPSTSFHVAPTTSPVAYTITIISRFPLLRFTRSPCRSFPYHESRNDNAPSRGATLHAETSRTSSPSRSPYPHHGCAPFPPPHFPYRGRATWRSSACSSETVPPNRYDSTRPPGNLRLEARRGTCSCACVRFCRRSTVIQFLEFCVDRRGQELIIFDVHDTL